MAVAHEPFDRFVETVRRMCDPQDGCPWNRSQTHESLADYMIEESYEAADAMLGGSSSHLCEELGDVLLQVVLNSQIAANQGEFDIDDVCETINAKMIRRHPHVFGNAKARTANEVNDLWEQVKLAEKAAAVERDGESAGGAEASLLDDVPKHFPALLQAQKISRRAVAAGFEWETVGDVWQKVAEEHAELEEAYALAPKGPDGRMEGDAPTAEDGAAALDPRVAAAQMEFGDLLFALVNVGRKMGIDTEAALRASNEKFRRRFASMERAAAHSGRSIEQLDSRQLEALWAAAKSEEDHG